MNVRANVTSRHRRFAELYVSPKSETHGNWEASALEAGFERVLSRGNRRALIAVQEYAQRQNLAIPSADQMDVEEVEAAVSGEEPQEDEDLVALATMPDNADWLVMAEVAKRVMRKAISGRLVLSTAQVQLIKETIGRAEGRIGQQAQDNDDEVVHVVILPTQQTNHGPIIDLGAIEQSDASELVPGLTLRQALGGENRGGRKEGG